MARQVRKVESNWLCRDHRNFAIPIKIVAVEISMKRAGRGASRMEVFHLRRVRQSYAKQDAADTRNAV